MLRTTYHVEVEEVNFTHGLPAWMAESLSGSSTTKTFDYTNPYGSHYAMSAKGKAGDGAVLTGSPLSTSVVKVLEIEAIGVTVTGPAELSLGATSPGGAGIQLDALSIDTGADHSGRVRLLIRDGTAEGETTLFAAGRDIHLAGSATVIDDLDLAVIIDSEAKTAQAHLGYSYVSCGPEGFPVNQILAPTLKAALVVDGEAEVKVRRLTIGTYS